MDIFIEQLVKKKRKMIDIAKTVLYVLLPIIVPSICVLLAYVTSPYFIYIGLFCMIALIYIAWYLITCQAVEFEYCVTNSNITIDRIVAKRKRKKLVDMEIRSFDLLCKASDKRITNKKFAKMIIAASDIDSDSTYAATYNSEAYGSCVLFFTPDERTLTAMRPYLKREIVMELFLNKK